MKVLEITHSDACGNIIWRRQNIYNTLHGDGEQFMLLSLFTGGSASNPFIPNNYYLGLDNRPTVNSSDKLTNLTNEPTSGGYSRQPVSSVGGFTVEFVNSNWRASSAVVTFRSTGTEWGPISNLFLSTSADNSGYLIATAVLGSTFTVPPGNTVSLRLGLSLKDC